MSAGAAGRAPPPAAALIGSVRGLIESRREARSIVYSASYGTLRGLIGFLMKDCCGGRPEICAPLIETVSACCPPKKRAGR